MKGARYEIVIDSTNGEPSFSLIAFEPAPDHIRDYLFRNNWTITVVAANTERWSHTAEKHGLFTWEQAMSLEFHRFIMLGRG